MSAASLVAFNLTMNAIGSFAVGYLLSRAVLPLLRHTPGKLTMFVVALPFTKVIFDLARGIPGDSFLWFRARGISQDLGSFVAGIGIHLGIPKVELAFGAMYDGRRYVQSAADLGAAGLIKLVGASGPIVVVGVTLSIGVLLFVRRALAVRALIARRRRLEGAGVLGAFTVGRRAVELLGDAAASTPYTGGVLRPFVALPASFMELPDEERAAALAHELGHVAQHHVLWTTLAGVVCDLFWFVPGIHRARRTFHASCEASADRWAVERGTDPVVLASALVRCHELASASGDLPRGTLPAVEATVGDRVRRLLDEVPRPRFALARPGVRLAVAAWATAAVFLAAGFGNH